MTEQSSWPQGGGEMGARVRAHDWAATPLGPIDGWSAELKLAASLVLENHFPAALVWGPDLVTIHNDDFRLILGAKPDALGRSFDEIWSEAWHEVGPVVERAFAGKSTFNKDYPVAVERSGRPEQAYFSFSYSPVRALDGSVLGMIGMVVETTERVRTQSRIGETEERQAFLLKLSDALRPLSDPLEIKATACRIVGEHLNSDRSYYLEFDAARAAFVVEQDYHREGAIGLAGLYPYADYGEPHDFFHTPHPLLVEDVANSPVMQPGRSDVYECIGIKSFLSVPLYKNESPVAALAATDARCRIWTKEEASLLVAVAERTWEAVERARAEAALRENEERLRLVVESATDYAIFVTDPDGVITDWLPGAEAVFGWTAAEAVGREAAITFTREDQAEQVPEAELDTAARAGFAADVRWHQRKDGSHVFIEGGVTPLRHPDGSIRGYLKMGQDASERRHAQEAMEASERRMRSLATGIPQLVFRSMGDGCRTWGSPQWIGFTGLSFEESLGHGWLAAVHPDERQASLAAWEDAEARGEYYAEHRILHAASSQYRWHQTRATPLRDDRGRILEWLGTSTDVEELRSLQRRQELLVAELQHRVRNLLAMIRSIGRRSAATASSVEDYAQHLEGRISALARTQALLTREIGRGVDLQNLVLDELEAQAALPSRYAIDGRDVALSAKAAEVLTLAIHELATNSVKYGALAHADGRIQIGWKVDEGDGSGPPWLDFTWAEFGVTMDGGPRREGFGTELITGRVPYELKGEGRMDFRETGVMAMIRFPLVSGASVLQTDAHAGAGVS